MYIFCRYSTDMEENANKLHFKCTDFNPYMHVTVCAECICVLIIIILSLLLNTMLIVTSAVTNFRCHRLIAKANK